MENNFYLNIEVEYDEFKKGHRGKFSYHETIHHKYLRMEDVDNLIKEIKRDCVISNYIITICIDNLDWYGNNLGLCRLYNDYSNKIKYVVWDYNNPHNILEDRHIDKKEIKSIINETIDKFNEYVNEQLTK